MTSAFLQQIIVVAIVFAAAGFLAAKAIRAVLAARSKRQTACASGCGPPPAAGSPKDSHAHSRR